MSRFITSSSTNRILSIAFSHTKFASTALSGSELRFEPPNWIILDTREGIFGVIASRFSLHVGTKQLDKLVTIDWFDQVFRRAQHQSPTTLIDDREHNDRNIHQFRIGLERG